MGSTALRVRRISLYLVWTTALMPVQAIGLALRRSWTRSLPRFYHRRSCRILGIDVRAIGAPAAERPLLIASNHTGYLDIAVLGSLIEGSFVAKSEIAGWPLFGALARLQRSVFLDRSRKGATAEVNAVVADRLAHGEAIVLFAEG
ncbi:MAG: 1-acyl-sn-glycerol-3-phosphate acyltransferase, partial [Alphaproteobacteria bacterium]|nr:1-acyl-sn-glycerol-3-phosphate acyltransferase [Alphaproteobacteria bacterium]